MAFIEVSDKLALWVGENVPKTFERINVAVSESALTLFAVALEAQLWA